MRAKKSGFLRFVGIDKDLILRAGRPLQSFVQEPICPPPHFSAPQFSFPPMRGKKSGFLRFVGIDKDLIPRRDRPFES
jgi:hypothetical protein